MSVESWKKSHEFKEMSSNALLLSFDKPIIHDLCIPSFRELDTSIRIVSDVLDGKVIDISKIDCCSDLPYHGLMLSFDSFQKFPERVVKGLKDIFFMGDRDSDPFLEQHLHRQDLFGSEWIMNYGTLYRFREGKREEVSREIESYFNSNEVKALKEIGDLMVPYASRLHIPHQLKP